MKFLNFTIIKLCLALLAGILAGFHFNIPEQWLAIAVPVAIFLFFFAFLRTRRQIFPDMFFGISTFLLFFLVGITTTYLHKPENKTDHYIHKIQPEEIKSSNTFLRVKLSEELKPNLYGERYIGKAKALLRDTSQEKVQGKLLLNIVKDSLSTMEPGDELIIPFRPEEINSPLNPHQFDYRNYMSRQQVLHQINLSSAEILSLNTANSGIRSLAASFRKHVLDRLETYNFNGEEMAIIQALLLGQRQDISPKTYERYAAAGAIHILAISGLHVGIILLLLNWLLKPLSYSKGGKFLTTALLLLFLWSFAIVAGLSPSVVRAGSMFSFIAIGMQLQRKTSVMNSLFVSLFLLLLINPYLVFQVGFQLSYLAVFSIITIQPFLYDLYNPKFKIPKYFWGILTVSVAAQIGVLPFSLYYFNQFPGLFFLTNIIIVPFLGLILGLGILVIFLSWIDLLPSILANFFANIISTLNQVVEWIAKQESFVFTDIHFPLILAMAGYVLVFMIVVVIHQPGRKSITALLIGIIGFQLLSFYEKSSHTNPETVIFHKSRNSLLGFNDGKKLQLYHNLDSLPMEESSIKSYKTAKGIEIKSSDTLRNIYNFSGKSLLLVDSSGVYDIPGLKPELVLLTNSPKVNLERLLEKIKTTQIIADGSNYTTYVDRWKSTCKKEKIPFHYTREKGAFMISKKDP